jgi:hypothetical protein
MRATSFVGRECTDLPSSTISPDVGESRRASERSSVDLPHPFAPTIVVILPGAMARSSPSMMVRSP